MLCFGLLTSCQDGSGRGGGSGQGQTGGSVGTATGGATAGTGVGTTGAGSTGSAGGTGTSTGSQTDTGTAGGTASGGTTGGEIVPDELSVDWLREIWATSRNDVPWGAVIDDGAVYVAGIRTEGIDLFVTNVDDAKQQLRLTKHDLATGDIIASQSAKCSSSFFNVLEITHARGIAVDDAGNLYVAGHSRCDEMKISYQGKDWTTQTDIKADGVLIGFKPTLEPLWIETQQSDDEDKTESVAVFGSSVYIAGHYSGSKLKLKGTTYLNNRGGFDVYIAQYTTGGAPTGKVIGVGGSEDDGQPAIAVDDVGNVYVTGYMRSTPGAVYDKSGTLAELQPVGANAEAFVLKLSPDLDLLWASVLGGPGDDKGKSLAVQGGDVYAVGFFEDAMTLPGCCDLVGKGGKDGFLAILNADGTARAGVGMGGMGTDRLHSARVLPATGRVVVAGSFTGDMDIGPYSLTGTGKEAFWASFDRDGNAYFAGNAQGAKEDEATALAAFDDILTVAGHFASNPISVENLSAGKSGDKSEAFLLRMTLLP